MAHDERQFERGPITSVSAFSNGSVCVAGRARHGRDWGINRSSRRRSRKCQAAIGKGKPRLLLSTRAKHWDEY